MFAVNDAPMCPAVDAATQMEDERMERIDVARKAAALAEMTVAELREQYREVFDEECRSRHKGFLRRRILWGLQAEAEGGLEQRALDRAAEIADDAHLRLEAPSQRTATPARTRAAVHRFSTNHDRDVPLPGTILRREYKGRTIKVAVLDSGFEYKGELHRSLTAIAEEVTGTHWNGMAFFGLRRNGGTT